MSVRVCLVGLERIEAEAIGRILDRMCVPVEVYDEPSLAKAAIETGSYTLAIVGFEGEGCGLPLALGLRPANQLASAIDCIVVVGGHCATLGKAAKDLGLLAVLERPVSAKGLALAVEAHVSNRIEHLGIQTQRTRVG